MIKSTPFKKDYLYFRTCCSTLNLSQAAEIHGMGQSAMSKIILQLEHEHKAKLFERTSRGLKLTAAGSHLKKSIEHLEHEWIKSQSQNTDVAAWQQRLTVGFHPVIARSVLPLLAPALYQQNIEFDLTTVFGTSKEITQKVNRLEIDLGFVINPIRNPNLIPKKIRSEHVGIWKKKKNHVLLMYNPDMYLAPKILTKLSHQYKLIPVHNYEVIAASVAADTCYGILPNPIAEAYNFEKIGSELIHFDLCMIVHESKFQISERKDLIQFMTETLKDL
ncbi:LysR family transcriptional regulator [Pseudobdellovibrio sp. HCB154]|uniref:LysR family transcriptional regulator n=1 Tax=Pseudobdellovibrio sp. HCB154 TaxID=3386277 RepID=UPI003916FA6C